MEVDGSVTVLYNVQLYMYDVGDSFLCEHKSPIASLQKPVTPEYAKNNDDLSGTPFRLSLLMTDSAASITYDLSSKFIYSRNQLHLSFMNSTLPYYYSSFSFSVRHFLFRLFEFLLNSAHFENRRRCYYI
jgi:hypothetical protein